MAPALDTRNRPPADQPDFERALDAVAVRGGDPSTTLRVDFRQPAMQPRLPARPRGESADAGADACVAPRHLGEPAQKGPQVEERAPGENRAPSARRDVVAHRAR